MNFTTWICKNLHANLFNFSVAINTGELVSMNVGGLTFMCLSLLSSNTVSDLTASKDGNTAYFGLGLAVGLLWLPLFHM